MDLSKTIGVVFDRVRHAPLDVYRGAKHEFSQPERRLRAGSKIGFSGLFGWSAVEFVKIAHKGGLLKWEYPDEKVMTVMLVGAAVPSAALPFAAAESFRRTGARNRLEAEQQSFLEKTFE